MSPEPQDVRAVIRPFFALAGGFWRGPKAWKAWMMAGLVLAGVLAQIGVQLGVNGWNRLFFDALERRDAWAVLSVAAWVPLVILAVALTFSMLSVSKAALQVHWRAWMTNRLAGWWIADQRYYRLGLVAPEQSAPEYRIAEDVRLATEPIVEFAVGLASAVLTAATFATVLWYVAGSIRVGLGGETIEVPAYMAIAAVLYAIAVSGLAYGVGRPLVALAAERSEREARFRAELTRLRENAESIALIRGDKGELASVRGGYRRVFDAWVAVVRREGFIALALNANSALFPILPLMLVAPKYLAGDLTLGAVVQVVAAFAMVQGALIWFVDNFVRLAEWYASASRVIELTGVLADLDVAAVMEGESVISLGESDDDAIHIENLSVAEIGGRVVINDASVRIRAGERVLIVGESGSGKSVLIRALAGLWPWGSGSIRVPRGVEIEFLPQRGYLPLGTLRAGLAYPAPAGAFPDADVGHALRRCGLGYLVARLDENGVRWDQRLSGGELQRVAFCRLLLRKPQIIIMDEATSALDEDSQFSLLTMIREELVASTIVSVGHRPGLEDFHDRKIALTKRRAGAEVTTVPLPSGLRRLAYLAIGASVERSAAAKAGRSSPETPRAEAGPG